MSIEQLRSIRQSKLRRRAKAYGARVCGKNSHAVPIAFVGDVWIDGYNAAVADVRKIIKEAGGPEHTIGSEIIQWADEQEQETKKK
jgi:hypothetical protein